MAERDTVRTSFSTSDNEPYIGQSVSRREDLRLLTGQAQFVEDIQLVGMLDVALVRSQYAHARIADVDVTAARARIGVECVVDGAELIEHLPPLGGMQITAPPGWAERVEHETNLPSQPILAAGVAHYVGEPLAAVVAVDKARAMDAAEAVSVSMEPLEVVRAPVAALADGAILVHESLGTNLIGRMAVSKGAVDAALAQAPHRLSRRIEHHRYAAMPLECRGVVAQYDARTDELTVWSNSQVVFWVRAAIAAALGMPPARVRVIAPDVGGGFGVKGHVYPEDVLVPYLARKLRRPVRWIESRTEHFLGSTHSRDHVHDVEFGFDSEGTLLALRDECYIDSGAYSPIGPGVAYNTTAHLLGPYQVANFAATISVASTHKAPNAPYRGAGRPEAVQVMERVLDVIATTLAVEPAQVRFRNLIQPEQMPYDVGLPYRDGQPIVYDSGDYPKALERALAELGGVDAFRRRQSEARSQGRLLGMGLGCYTEGTGVGPFEGARVEIDASGTLIVSVGACAQGQGHETVFAQVVAQQWKVDLENVVIRGGDTAGVSMGYGTVGSRSAVTASMAIVEASDTVRRKVFAVAGELLEAAVDDLELRDGAVGVVGAPGLQLSLAEIAQAAAPGWQHRRPPGIEAGLEASAYYEPPTVTWSYAANAAIVEVMPDTGEVVIERYVEVHDAGVLLNPALADGQIMGGIAQGLGGALSEAIVYDDSGQLLTGSFVDYAMPRAADIPPVSVIHYETPSPLNALGVKGLGEGGAIAPPVVIANAVGDALRHTEVEFNSLPLRAELIRAAMKAN